MAEVQITVEGLDELQKDLERLISKYPDKAGELLKKDARDFRKAYIKNVRGKVKRASNRSKSLTKIKNVKIYPIQGYGKKQSIDVGATSPHFHLFERGHVLYPFGKGPSGFVPGRFVMEESINEYEDKMPETARKMYDKLLQEANLT
ncbi:MAG: hypothetical protein IJV16_10805 [Lachnospiraceae bacterium]|nr:hypothetical protein [Lachnospiraceae bacterium]